MIVSIPFVVPIATGAPLAVDYDCIGEMGRPMVGIRAGTTGTIALEMATGGTISVKSVWQGETLWLSAVRILADGTTVQDALVYFDAR
jgi:hypothetical protein